jgi:hypothetical protein
VTRQPSAQITLRPTSAALADIRSQRTMPSAYGGALRASSALITEAVSVPVSFRPRGCSPITDLARFGSAVQRLSRAAGRAVTAARSSCPRQIVGTFPEHWERFAQLISQRVPFSEAERAFDLVLRPGQRSRRS